MPLATRLLLVLAVVVGGFALYLTASGGLGRIVTAFGGRVDGMVDSLTATPTPRPSVITATDPPELAKPLEPYTNQPTVDVQVSLPPRVAGTQGTVRLWLGPPPETDAPPTVVQEVPVGPDDKVVIPGVRLQPGRNDFTATIRNAAGESEHSPVVTYVLDVEVPPLEILLPADGEEINAATVMISGKSQGRAAIVARNGHNDASVAVEASTEGTWEVELPLGPIGRNQIGITATDPAGNVATKLFTVIRGDGKLTAVLTADPEAVDVDNLPQPMKLTVLVTDPDDKPLEGAQVTFTLAVPDVQVVTSNAVTAVDGTAVFDTTVPAGTTAGEAVAAVLVRTEKHGETNAALEFGISN